MGEGALILRKKIADSKEIQFFFFFTKGSSSEWASKALPETSSIATVTDVVEVIPSNSQENSQTTDSNILSTEKRKG